MVSSLRSTGFASPLGEAGARMIDSVLASHDPLEGVYRAQPTHLSRQTRGEKWMTALWAEMREQGVDVVALSDTLVGRWRILHCTMLGVSAAREYLVSLNDLPDDPMIAAATIAQHVFNSD